MAERRVNVDQMADAIAQSMAEFADLSSEVMKECVTETSKSVKKEIQENAPVRTGKYKKSWAAKKVKENANSLTMVVHSRDRYQIAHLLEHGHAKRGGGRVLVDVMADIKEQIGTAAGTIVVPIPAQGEDGKETTQNISVKVELPVTFSADGKASAFVRYEFNDEEILTHYPVENWGSGKHVLPLYYPIENLIPNFTNTFNVYLRMEGGSGTIETGGCIASVSGQGMAAALAWDGKITIEETISAFQLGAGFLVKDFTESIGIETMVLVQRQMADSMGRISIGAFGSPVDTS